jgi:hypothetical protein
LADLLHHIFSRADINKDLLKAVINMDHRQAVSNSHILHNNTGATHRRDSFLRKANSLLKDNIRLSKADMALQHSPPQATILAQQQSAMPASTHKPFAAL